MNLLLPPTASDRPVDTHRPLLSGLQAVVLMLAIAVFGVLGLGWLFDWPQPEPPARHEPATHTTTGDPR